MTDKAFKTEGELAFDFIVDKGYYEEFCSWCNKMREEGNK